MNLKDSNRYYPSAWNVVQEGDKKSVWGTEWWHSRNILVDKTWHTGQCIDGICVRRTCWIFTEKLFYSMFDTQLVFDEYYYYYAFYWAQKLPERIAMPFTIISIGKIKSKSRIE